KSLLGIENARPACGAFGELDRSLNAFGPRVGEKHVIELSARGHALFELRSKQPRKQRRIKCHHRGVILLEELNQRLIDRRMVPAHVVNGIAALKIKVLVALHIPEIWPERFDVDAVKPDRPENTNKLRIDVIP